MNEQQKKKPQKSAIFKLAAIAFELSRFRERVSRFYRKGERDCLRHDARSRLKGFCFNLHPFRFLLFTDANFTAM